MDSERTILKSLLAVTISVAMTGCGVWVKNEDGGGMVRKAPNTMAWVDPSEVPEPEPNREITGSATGVVPVPVSPGSMGSVKEATPVSEQRPAEAEEPGSDVTQTAEMVFGSGTFVKATRHKKGSEKSQQRDITLNYQKTELREVIKTILGDILEENYFIDDSIKGEVTLRTSQPITRDDLIPTLESMLKMNGAALIRSNGLYQVIPENADLMSSASSSMRLSSDKGFQVLVVPLHYIAATEMKKILAPIQPKKGRVDIDQARNLLVMAAQHSELANLRETVKLFDVDQLKGMSVGVFPLRIVEANVLVDELDKVFGEETKSPLAGMVKFVPIKRLNTLIVLTPQKKYLKEVSRWVKRLDIAATSGGASLGLHVYEVQNGEAANLASMLQEIFGEGKDPEKKDAAAPGAAPGRQAAAKPQATTQETTVEVGEVSFVADEENNLLLVRASAADYDKIQKALDKLDAIPRQVLVEVSIVEIDLKDKLRFGLEWFFENQLASRTGSALLDFGGSGLATVSGFSYSILDSAGAIQAVINTLASESKANVISTPSLMVLDNHSATIRVGKQVPIRTSETSNTGSSGTVVNTIQYRDTGIILKVKPRVNSSGMVIMDVAQEVSDVSEISTEAIQSPTINTREIDTSIAVQSGETVVLGGLITNNDSDSTSGIPGLRNLPFVGGLFGATERSNSRSELVVLITPSTINDIEDIREVTREYKKGMKSLNFDLRRSPSL